MRVLHLPLNIASQASATVMALRAIGVDARGLVRTYSNHQDSEGVESFAALRPAWRPGNLWRRFRFTARELQLIRWADVIHWHYNAGFPGGLDLHLATALGKRQFVEFWGSDIRIPEIEAADNPEYAAVLDRQEYRREESRRVSERRQRRFARAGATALVSVGMAPYLQPGLFRRQRAMSQRIDCARIMPAFPDPAQAEPLVIHAPSAPVIKGTEAVLASVDALRGRLPFRFALVQGLPRHEALELMRRCDVFVDQLRLGSHGLAAVEAMAMGKPVICYIKPALLAQYPADLPLVSATPASLPQVLESLLRDGPRRRELGERGRRYAERHHDALVIARELAALYGEAMSAPPGA